MNIKRGLKIALRVLCLGIVLWIVMYSDFSFQNEDIIKYEGEKYSPVEFGRDIFMYYCNESGEEYPEEGEIYRVNGSAYDMILCEGDVYCVKDQVEEAISYYADDANYTWSVVIDSDDTTTEYPIDVTADEMAYLNSIENQPQEVAIFFEEIEKFATLTKTSKDGIISGVTELAYYDGSWYWRSEIIDESREKDGTWPEYVHKLPETLSEKITNAVK